MTRRSIAARRGAALAAAVIAALAPGCTARHEAPPPAPGSDRPPPLSPEEIARGEDACRAYLDKVCACAATNPALAEACAGARTMPEAMRLSLAVAGARDVTRLDVLGAQDAARKVVKGCIEAAARLPAAGCP